MRKIILVTSILINQVYATDFMSAQDIKKIFKRGPASFEKYYHKPSDIIEEKLEDIIPYELRKNLNAQNFTNQDYSPYPEEVDLRFRDTPVKKQFGGTCTAFGLIGTMENLIGNNEVGHLSERHFWSQYNKYSTSVAITTAQKNKITEERAWPQNQNRPNSNYKSLAHSKLKSSVYLKNNVEKAIDSLSRGNPVYIGMSSTKGMGSCAAVVDPMTPPSKGGHALAVVGYRLDPEIAGGGYFLIKNSWGAKCGDKGYQYIPFNICKRSDVYCVMWEISEVETNFPIK